MPTRNFTTTVAAQDWDKNLGGWRCPALRIPGAEVAEIYVDGETADPTKYTVNVDQRLVRWSGERPRQATIEIKLTQKLDSHELTVHWKKLAIILPILASLLVTVINVGANKFLAPIQNHPPKKSSTPKNKILKISELNSNLKSIIDSYESNNFIIENLYSSVTLRERVKLDKDTVKFHKASPAIWRQTFEISRTTQRSNYFKKEIFTSGLTPDFSSSTHTFIFIHDNAYKSPPGRDKLKRYIILIDISEEPTGKPFKFQISIQFIFWNTYQNENESHTAIAVRNPTKNIVFDIFWPISKPIIKDSLRFYEYPEHGKPQEYNENLKNAAHLNDGVRWTINNPKVDWRYRLQWRW